MHEKYSNMHEKIIQQLYNEYNNFLAKSKQIAYQRTVCIFFFSFIFMSNIHMIKFL